ncbi:MAG: phosphatidylserine/phosphatidylglycerophosphate/cardiolipin synthase family protein [Polyangiaceae bacterium]
MRTFLSHAVLVSALALHLATSACSGENTTEVGNGGATAGGSAGQLSGGASGFGGEGGSVASGGSNPSGGSAGSSGGAGNGGSAGTTGGDGGGGAGGSGGATDAGVDSSTPPPQKEVVFTVPLAGGANDTTIEAKLGELAKAAAPGSQIRISLYHWSRQAIAYRFVDAQKAGVDVRVVLDPTNKNDQGDDWAGVATLKSELPSGHVTVCNESAGQGACIGSDTGINHNKFFLFSELNDGSKHVVVQSSANLTTTQLHKHNNLVIIRDDKALYDAYLSYWTDLQAQQQDLNYYRSFDGDTGTKAYFYPRASGDTILGVLDNVTCDAGTTIRVAMAFFTTGRSEIADKLVSKQQQGCAVTVVLDQENLSSGVASTLKSGGVSLYVFPTGSAGEGLHSKILIIHGTYTGTANRGLVWTGSHNYTGPALRGNDEALLKLDDPEVYAAFDANFAAIRGGAVKQ